VVQRIPLGEVVEPEYFDAVAELVSNQHSNHKSLNTIILAAKKKIREANSRFYKLTSEGYLLKPEEYCQAYRMLYNSDDPDTELCNLIENHSFVIEESTATVRTHFVMFEKRVPIDKYAEINILVDKYLAGIRDDFVQRVIDMPEFDESDDEQKMFMEAWDSYYRYCKMEKKESTYSRIPNNRRILIDFCKKYNKPLTFNAMNEDFGREFKYYLSNEHINIYTREKGVSNGTVHNIQKSVCAFLNWAHKRKLNSSLEFKKWDTKKPKSDQHYLREHELNQLVETQVPLNSSEEKAKDLFIFSAYTGMRFSDVKAFKKSFIQDGMIKYTSVKTGKKCMVKLLSNARLILEKYNYELPVVSDSHCNSGIKSVLSKIGITQVVSRTMQKGKKNIIIEKPLADFITFHSARRSFINLMISRNISIANVSTMVGNDLPSLMVYYKNDTTQIDKVMSGLDL